MEAAEVTRQAEFDVDRIRGEIPDRVARAQAAVFDPLAEQQTHEQQMLTDVVEAEVARLRTRADTIIPALTATVTDRIWSMLEPEPPEGDRP